MIRGNFRTFLNRVGGGVRLKKRLPSAFGRRCMMVTPSAYLRYWTHSLGTVHRELLDAIAQWVTPGDCFWDVGANVGVASFAAASRVGPGGAVLAIEPDVSLCSLLQQSRSRAGAAEAAVDILPVAVADKIGISRFSISSHGTTANALDGFGRMGGVKSIRVVPTFTLDWLLQHFRKPNVVKVDVEGAEWLVLQGASQLLASCRPILLCEVGSEVMDPVCGLLRERNYRLYDMASPAAARVARERIAGDVLALPAERAEKN